MPFFNLCQNAITWHPKIQYSFNLYCILPSTKKVLANQDINLNVAYSNEVGLQTHTIRSVLNKVYSLCNCKIILHCKRLYKFYYPGSLPLYQLYQLRKTKITSAEKYSLQQCHILAFCELSAIKVLQNQICEY
jgi:hypothetical protein